eukprot:6586545-Alexandrium_andersonii.AAC.1
MARSLGFCPLACPIRHGAGTLGGARVQHHARPSSSSAGVRRAGAVRSAPQPWQRRGCNARLARARVRG